MGLLDDLKKEDYSEGKVGEEERPLCPVCGDLMNLPIRIYTNQSRNQKTLWFQCFCGVIYNPYHAGDYSDFKKEYRAEGWKGRDSREYFVHVYFPLIEELTYGRKILEVGYCMPYILRKARDRGWICTGMDLHVARSSERGIEIIEDNFEDHNFKYRKYAEGVIFISSPDVGLMSKIGMTYWGNFDLRCRLMFSKECFDREMQRIGLKTILLRSNESRRFGHYNDFHGIWQKPFYDEPYIGGYDMGIDFDKVKKHIEEVRGKKENEKRTSNSNN